MSRFRHEHFKKRLRKAKKKVMREKNSRIGGNTQKKRREENDYV